MNVQSVLEIILCIFTVGITYGALNSRIKHVENTLKDYKTFAERLARIEEKLTLLINKTTQNV